MAVVAFLPGRSAADDAAEGIVTPDLDIVKQALRIDGDAHDAWLEQSIEAALALARRQAPNAPAAIGTQAIIRCCGYLFEVADTGVNLHVWARCGAEGLLSPWTARRAGAIG